MVIFGGTGALGVVFAAHHIENATPRSIVSTSVILASRPVEDRRSGGRSVSRASPPFVVRACGRRTPSLSTARRASPRDAVAADTRASGVLRDASVDATAHGATRIVTLGETFGGDSRRRRANSRRRRSSRIFPPSRRSSGLTNIPRRQRVVGRRASLRSVDRVRAFRPSPRSGARGEAREWRRAIRRFARDSREKDSGFSLRRCCRRATRAAIEGGDGGPHRTSLQPAGGAARGGVVAAREERAKMSRRRRGVPRRRRRTNGTDRGLRGAIDADTGRASPSIPTELNPSLRSRLCVPIDRSIWRR